MKPKKIIFVRHAKALDRGKARLKKISDPDRPLTADGVKEFKKHVQSYDFVIKKCELFVSSPYVRAVQTLDIVFKKLKLKKSKREVIAHLEPEADPVLLVAWLKKRKEKSIVLVSHEPFLTHFLSHVLKTDTSFLRLRKGVFISLNLDPETGRFELIGLNSPNT